jgi:hypothetical protein
VGVQIVVPENSPQHSPPAWIWQVLAADGAVNAGGSSGGAQAPLARCASEQQNEPVGHAPDAGAGPQTAPPSNCRQHWPPAANRQVAAGGGAGTPGAVPAAGPGGSSGGPGGVHWPLACCASEQQIEPAAHAPDAGTGLHIVP